ncbi:hypothetical protein Tco_1344364 [Tanacetum coccineum]
MDLYHSRLIRDDLNDLFIKYKILCDLYPQLPFEEFVMSELPDDAIGIYHRMFDFYVVRIPFSSFLLALIKHYMVHFSQLGPLGLNKVITFKVLCRSLQIEPTKSGFFLDDRRAIPDAMVWRHPGAAIDDPRPAAGSFSMVDVRRLSAHVIKLRDMPEVMGIHDFLCLPEWTGAKVQEEPHLDIRPTLQRLKLPRSERPLLLVPSAKRTRSALAQSFGSTTRPSLFVGNSDDESDGNDDACVEIPMVTPLCSADVIPSSRNQGRSFIAPATEDYRGKGIMAYDAAAPFVGVSRPRHPLVMFLHSGMFLEMLFMRTSSLFLLVRIMPPILKMALLGIASLLVRSGMLLKALFEDQLTAKMSVLHCMMMSHGGDLLACYCGLLQSHHEYVQLADSRLKGYGEKSKAKGNKRKKKIKSLTKRLDNLHAEVARLSAALNHATILEAEKDEEILRLKTTPQDRVQGKFLSLGASAGFECGLSIGIEYQEKDKNKVKTDKTGHEIEKSVKSQDRGREILIGNPNQARKSKNPKSR